MYPPLPRNPARQMVYLSVLQGIFWWRWVGESTQKGRDCGRYNLFGEKQHWF